MNLLLIANIAFASGAPADAPAKTDVSVSSSAFRREDYTPSSTKKVLQELPCAKKQTALKDALFSFEAAYQGAKRAASPARVSLLKEWTKSIGDAPAYKRYLEEWTLVEGSSILWTPVPEALARFMEMDLLPGDRFTAYMVFVGCVDGEPLFAVDEFEVLEQAPAEINDQLI